MLEFEVIENLKPINDLIGILKDFKYKIKLGQIKIILHTNLKVITPTEYQITYSTTLTLLEYKVNE
ncbi:unknown [Clostridium sp. CAG:628]|nr:unknown [Clostridium sp. CAG:628]